MRELSLAQKQEIRNKILHRLDSYELVGIESVRVLEKLRDDLKDKKPPSVQYEKDVMDDIMTLLFKTHELCESDAIDVLQSSIDFLVRHQVLNICPRCKTINSPRVASCEYCGYRFLP